MDDPEGPESPLTLHSASFNFGDPEDPEEACVSPDASPTQPRDAPPKHSKVASLAAVSPTRGPGIPTALLTTGTTLTKYTWQAAKCRKACLLKLNADFTTLFIGSKTVALADLERPMYGRVSDTFDRVPASESVDPVLCFSLASAERTWDLVADDDEQLVKWFVGLDFFIIKALAMSGAGAGGGALRPLSVNDVRAMVDGERAAMHLYGHGPRPATTYLAEMSHLYN